MGIESQIIASATYEQSATYSYDAFRIKKEIGVILYHSREKTSSSLPLPLPPQTTASPPPLPLPPSKSLFEALGTSVDEVAAYIQKSRKRNCVGLRGRSAMAQFHKIHMQPSYTHAVLSEELLDVLAAAVNQNLAVYIGERSLLGVWDAKEGVFAALDMDLSTGRVIRLSHHRVRAPCNS